MAGTTQGPQLPSEFEAYLAFYDRMDTDDLVKFMAETAPQAGLS